jgi:Outer membrane protein beta-barrel domain
MKKVAGIFLLLAFCSLRVSAQELSLFGPLPVSSVPANPEPLDKPQLPHIPPPPKPHLEKPTRSHLELGGGYLYTSLLEADGKRLNMNGFSMYADYRIFRWLSAAADLSGSYNLNTVNGNTQLYTLMFGARIYPLGHRHKITPFGEFLIGPGYAGYNLEAQGGFAEYSHWGWSTAWMGGGGLDVKFKKRWTIRLIEADYEHTNFYQITSAGYGNGGQGNYRAAVGVIYRFGVQ